MLCWRVTLTRDQIRAQHRHWQPPLRLRKKEAGVSNHDAAPLVSNTKGGRACRGIKLTGWLVERADGAAGSHPSGPTALGVVGSDKEKAGVTGDANMHVGCGRDGRGQREGKEMVGSIEHLGMSDTVSLPVFLVDVCFFLCFVLFLWFLFLYTTKLNRYSALETSKQNMYVFRTSNLLSPYLWGKPFFPFLESYLLNPTFAVNL
jgi:hypothetical protein